MENSFKIILEKLHKMKEKQKEIEKLLQQATEEAKNYK